MTVRRRLAAAACFAGLVAVAQAPPALGAVVFGADLSQVPDANCSSCAALTLKTSTGADQPGSPVNGTLVSARVRTVTEGGVGVFRILRGTSNAGEYLNVGEVAVAVTPDATPGGHVTEVAAQLPIRIGDRLAVSFPGDSLHYI